MNNKGISMITLIVTIIVMVILIGIVGVYSFDTIDKSYTATETREFANVRDFVLEKQMRVETGEFTSYPSVELTTDELYLIADEKLNDTELNNIVDVNNSILEKQYKYYYVQSSDKYFESAEFVHNGTSIQDVKGDYIINFYTGTIIRVDDNKVKVDGIIKSLTEILESK